jgi:hypothetical protein
MATRRRGWRACGWVLLAAAAGWAAQDWQQAGERWWAHVAYLASPALEGRGTGSAGYQRAAAYVAQQFAAAGLEPAGTQGYLQPVPFVVRELDAAHSSVELVTPAGRQPLALGRDVLVSLRGYPAPELEAPAVFAGYGLEVPEAGWNDFAGLPVRGRLVVYLAGTPAGLPSAVAAHYQSAERWRRLRAAGALGLVMIPNPRTMEIPWERMGMRPLFLLADRSLREWRGLQVALTVNPAVADRLLKGSGHRLAELAALGAAGRPLPRFPLKVRLRVRQALRERAVESPNVVGRLPGADPQRARQTVVVSAHLDHLGVIERDGRRVLFPGAMDNASGVAALIEAARQLAAGPRPPRSLLFVAFTAEEQGELGSWYFVRRLPPAAGVPVADINMDMFLPLFPLRYLEVQGLDESTLGDDIRAVCREAGVVVQADKVPSANRFIRSDQYSFVRAGVPALAFKFGWTFGSPEQRIFDQWIAQRYHGPDDDTAQPVDRAAAAQFTALIARLAARVAAAPEPPRWLPSSFFRRFAHPGQPSWPGPVRGR